MNERIKKLKAGIYYKSGMAIKFKATEELKGEFSAVPEFRTDVKICLDRARLITESYKFTEGEPMVIRRAKALKNILENMTIYIEDSELLVGNFASNPWSIPLYPEVVHKWITEAINNGHRDMLDEKGKKEYREIIKYWEGKSVDEMVRKALPDELHDYVDYLGPCYTSHFNFQRGAASLNFEKLFKFGLNGIIEEIEEALSEIIKSYKKIHAKEYIERRNNLEAMKIAATSVINFSQRYAQEAKRTAGDCKDGKRKKELEKIAEICQWVPANPPRTLREAMQSFFICDLVRMCIEANDQGNGARLDLLMNPFYQEDKKREIITRDEAQEVVECLMIKLSQWGHLDTPDVTAVKAGISDVKDLNIGGITKEGEDATNEFSFIILDAAMDVRVPEPTIALRYHPRVSKELILKAIDVVRTGIGYPSFYNDTTVIPWLTDRGIPLKDARNYSILACISPSIPGKNMRCCRPNFGAINLAKCLELAFYQGKDKDTFTGKQLGVKTPDPTTFKSFDEMKEAYFTQVRFFGDKMVRIDNIGQAFYDQYLLKPFTSSLLDGCIEKGKDCVTWRWHPWPNALMCGSTNVADSLAAVKKFVFDDKIITMEELIEALRTNWEGKEELRQRLINEAPKFGNDDDYVDEIAREVHVRSNEEFGKTKDYWGYAPILDGSIAGGYFGLSKAVGATPDGRRDSESCADAVLSPMAGRDKNGPTAVLKSTGKVDPTYPHLFNQKFLPQFLEGENKETFAQYLRTWSDLGHWHIQFNVVGKDTLLDAQQHPEKYQDLVVRVAGYSAYFVDLSRGIQDDIVARCEQRF